MLIAGKLRPHAAMCLNPPPPFLKNHSFHCTPPAAVLSSLPSLTAEVT